jgi:hypothetical protein
LSDIRVERDNRQAPRRGVMQDEESTPMPGPTPFRLWDTERSMSIPVADVQLTDVMVYVVSLAADMDMDATQLVHRQRILSEDYALLELADGTTMLVELMDDGADSAAAIAPPGGPTTVRYLIVG